MKKQILIFIIVLVFLFGCQPAQPQNSPTTMVAATETSTPPRWMEYERALAKAVVNTEDALCEWEILGQAEQEVYVWALCKVKAPIGSTGSVPAVIQLGKNHEIEKITIPRDGNFYPQDLLALFPEDIREKGLSYAPFDSKEAEYHIDERLGNNGPPLIAIEGIPLP